MTKNSNHPLLLNTAEISWPAETTPHSNQYDDIYYSPDDGIAESDYVFIQKNHLGERWQQLDPEQAACFVIAETGFGSGLNFLLAWQLWQQYAPANWRLQFISVENSPMHQTDICKALQAWTSLEKLSEQLLANYPPPIKGQHHIILDESVSLTLCFGDAAEGFEQLRPTDNQQFLDESTQFVDAWFLDGFAPAKNPQMWTEELFTLIGQLSKPGCTFSTFTAAGIVKRGLQQQGFSVEKCSGFGRKREMLTGVKTPSATTNEIRETTNTSKDKQTPWYLNLSQTDRAQQSTIVIGGGLAGVMTARALAKRGSKVHLIESKDTVAAGGSGNLQGMMYLRLSPHEGMMNHFNLTSFHFALRYYKLLLQHNHIVPEDVDFCGVMQLAHNTKELKLMQELQDRIDSDNDWIQFLSADQASQKAGITLHHPATFYPSTGWISPRQICHKLIHHSNIHVSLNTKVADIHYDGKLWSALDESNNFIATAPTVVLANGHLAKQWQQTTELPLKPIRGQVTDLPSSSTTAQLTTVLCHEGYLTPAKQGYHSLGATFDNDNESDKIISEDHQRNIDSLRKVLPEISFDTTSQQLNGRAAIRCASADYLPVAGPVAKYEEFINDYAGLGKNAKRTINKSGNYHPGLYINVAHGSKGLSSIPLCSELIASQIHGEPAPIHRDMALALHPARFIIRNIIRGKI